MTEWEDTLLQRGSPRSETTAGHIEPFFHTSPRPRADSLQDLHDESDSARDSLCPCLPLRARSLALVAEKLEVCVDGTAGAGEDRQGRAH
jgi:hypothetical protein